MKPTSLGGCLALFLCTALAAEPMLETIELQARSAEELLPILRPLAGVDVALAGKGAHLFVRASPERLAELRRVIEQLDRPARQLMISVYQGRLRQRDLAAFGIRQNTAAGEPGVIIKQRNTRDGLAATHRLRVSEGSAAFIATGADAPETYRHFSAGVGGVQQTLGTAYRPHRSGFYAAPRITGERVSLDISPFAEHPDAVSGDYSVQNAVTRLTGRLGEWIEVGGVTQAADENRQAIMRRRSTRRQSDYRILLKVDPITPTIAP